MRSHPPRSVARRAGHEARDNHTQLFIHSGATAIYGGKAQRRRGRDLHAMAQRVALNHETASRHSAGFLDPPGPRTGSVLGFKPRHRPGAIRRPGQAPVAP